MDLWQTICAQIGATLGEPFSAEDRYGAGGGCISEAVHLRGSGREFFVKLNRQNGLEMFEAEADGLRELAATSTLCVPRPLVTGVATGRSYIVMESLALGGSGSMAAFGEQLAALHRHTRSHYGWYRHNTIGSTHQINTLEEDWGTFWRRHRLGFQLDLAVRNGGTRALREQGARLMEVIPGFFADYTPSASLLHGDLWSGNYAFTRIDRASGVSSEGAAAIFDPAVYYGDREAELAMTELFGGFGGDFYAAYNATWPLDPGYQVRKTLYNLYHILNHFNIFGGGYGTQAERMVGQLLSEVG